MKQSIAALVAEFESRFEDDERLSLDEVDLDLSLKATGLRQIEFADAVALHVGKAFQAGTIGYDFADWIMNELHKFAYVLRDVGATEFFLNVFEAFDAGEFHRREDKSDDPVEEYTRPLLAEALKGR